MSKSLLMINVLNNLDLLLEFYIMRHIALVILFLIVIDFFWKNQNFKFSYGVVRYALMINWMLNLFLLPFNWKDTASFVDRATGPYWWAYSIMLICSFLIPAMLLHKQLGRNKWALLVIGFLSTFGLNFELFVILLTSIHQDYLPSSTVRLYLSYLFLRPFIITCFLVGIDVLFFRNYAKNKTVQPLNEEILDSE